MCAYIYIYTYTHTHTPHLDFPMTKTNFPTCCCFLASKACVNCFLNLRATSNTLKIKEASKRLHTTRLNQPALLTGLIIFYQLEQSFHT